MNERKIAKLSASWLVQSSRTDLALNQVVTDPPIPTPSKVEIQLEIDYICSRNSLGMV